MKIKYRLKSNKTGNYVYFEGNMIRWVANINEATEFNSHTEIEEKKIIVNSKSTIVEAFISND